MLPGGGGGTCCRQFRNATWIGWRDGSPGKKLSNTLHVFRFRFPLIRGARRATDVLLLQGCFPQGSGSIGAERRVQLCL